MSDELEIEANVASETIEDVHAQHEESMLGIIPKDLDFLNSLLIVVFFIVLISQFAYLAMPRMLQKKIDFNPEKEEGVAGTGFWPEAATNVMDLPADLSISLNDTTEEMATDPVLKKIIITLEYQKLELLDTL